MQKPLQINTKIYGLIFLDLFCFLLCTCVTVFFMSIAPSTLNNASLVALLPHFKQNFDFPSTSSSGLQ
jgi:hypothetical protein